jgi:argininosuccinate synthase
VAEGSRLRGGCVHGGRGAGKDHHRRHPACQEGRRREGRRQGSQEAVRHGLLLARAQGRRGVRRPLHAGHGAIAAEQVAVAHAEKATAVGHGCTGKGNDQVRFEVTIQALDSKLEILAPVREWEFKSRDEEIDYALEHNIPIDITKKSSYSIDKNVWGVSVESGVLEDPNVEPPQDSFQWTRGAEKRNPKDRVVEIEFKEGIPVGLDGRRLGALDLVAELNEAGANYGIGRMDMIENRLVGIKSRETYEAPAATILMAAHADLESLVLDRELLHFKQGISQKYADLVYYGLWFTPLREALDAFIDTTQENVTGKVRVRLRKFNAHVVGRKSPYSRYNENLATYTAKDTFDHKLAKGFIDLWALPYRSGK